MSATLDVVCMSMFCKEYHYIMTAYYIVYINIAYYEFWTHPKKLTAMVAALFGSMSIMSAC